MKTISLFCFFGLAGLLTGIPLAAQPSGAPPGDRPDGPPGMFPPNPMFAALDENQDGELSKSEIENAPTRLMTLDKNQDGKISAEEVMPEFIRRRFGGPNGPGGPGGPGGFGGNLNGFKERIMAFDTNKDGKVAEAELPGRMRRIMEQVDTNQNGFLEESEIDAAAESRGPGRGPGRGAGRGLGNRPNRSQ